jgi:hypothetical protein
MLGSFATLDDAVYVVRTLSSQFAKYAEELSIGHLRPQGREVWTKAIWKSFEHLRNELGNQWRLFPDQPGKGPGKADGEFLVDFFLFDSRIGPRIACESELSPDDGKIEWAFDKLSSVKSDIKILIFERSFELGLPKFITEMTDRYLSDFGHIHKGEIYILTQLDHDLSKHYVWVAPRSGPFRQGDVVFTEMVFEQE